MGGFGGGMGAGMGGMGGQPSQRPFVTSVIPGVEPGRQPAASGGKDDLLEGLQDTRRGVQDEQVEKMQKTYQSGAGMGGLGAGGIF